jgi:glyoxylase-like metal-dependent hydrolase (beta-lactamase superfamily II)/8-oxo-dGTP pyrophosphatase MutT (NUDIX family)
VGAIQQAASVLLTRGAEAAEVLLVRRADHLRFFGGFWAFPGGKVAPDDTDRVVTAARELFEETGVLLARRADGSFPTPSPDLNEARWALIEEQVTFTTWLRDNGLRVDAAAFRPIGEITTPEFAPLRFATLFFVAQLPPNQSVVLLPGELAEVEWSTPAAMLQRWRRGECLLSPPTAMTLEAVEGRHVDEAPQRLGPLLAALDAGLMHPIYFAPEVQMLPLRTPGLPPVTHTNAYLVGTGPRYLLDPGADDPAEQQRLFEVLDAHQAQGRPLSAVVITHHHPDHVGAATACAQRYDVPVWAHERTAEQLQGRVVVHQLLGEGSRLELGTRPDGSGPWHLEALHTPGHASGHLAFYDPYYRLLYAGDMVSTMTSVVIVPPEGDLAVYLQSLRRLLEVPARLLLPAHGSPTARARHAVQAALDHRLERERQLVEVLRGGARTVEELGPEMYRGLPDPQMRFAHLQIRAGLEKLQREGRVEAHGDRWRLTGCEAKA